jgi:CrcB protein
MLQLAFIAIGGALGALARYGTALFTHGWFGLSWPLGTLLVNAAGSLGIGVVFVLLERSVIHPDWRSILMVGFLGAFTTFSTYALDSVELWLQGMVTQAVLYAVGSVVLCLGAAAAGIFITRGLLA